MVKVLIVEDEDIFQDYFVSIFERCGVPKENVACARTFAEGEKRIEGEEKYDIVFLDRHLPPNDLDLNVVDCGYTLLKVIREKQPQAIVIGTSSHPHKAYGQDGNPDKMLRKVDMYNMLEPLIKSILVNLVP